MADVTVVIPTRNRAGLLGEALRSLREQTTPPAEVIVADDGSVDDTPAVVHAFGARLLRNPGTVWGAAGGRNAGLREVRTELVSFVDSDDLLLPRAVEQLRDALMRAPSAPFAFGRALIARRGEQGWTAEGLIAPQPRELEALPGSLFARNLVHSSGGLVRTEEARAVGGFDGTAPLNEDFYFWVDLALRGLPVHVADVVSVYRVHETNRFVASAGADYERVAALGRRSPPLTGSLAQHLGARLLEHLSDAVHRRDARSVASGLRATLALSPNPARTLTAAGAHVRLRRVMTTAGIETWSREPQLRAWLATYAEPSESTGGRGSTASM